MHLKFRGVNDAFRELVALFHEGTAVPIDVVPSRVGEVMQILEPMTITYTSPKERVLFSQARDANPFLHLYEALYMLAGKNQIAPLEYYASEFGKFVRDEADPTFQNGAYGYRWRAAAGVPQLTQPTHGFYRPGVDQLKIIIDHLKRIPNSRRVVLQMWNVENDLLKIEKSKDVCCNTHIYFSIEDAGESKAKRFLNMTVCNRSNDLIYGMLGANVVHFSMLQEYMACALGVEVGVYNQFTNNLHAYTSRWYAKEWLAEPYDSYYYHDMSSSLPLVVNVEAFDAEVKQLVECHYGQPPDGSCDDMTEPFLREVALPMFRAFYFHKQREYPTAICWMEKVHNSDWHDAGLTWILKRRDLWEKKMVDNASA